MTAGGGEVVAAGHRTLIQTGSKTSLELCGPREILDQHFKLLGDWTHCSPTHPPSFPLPMCSPSSKTRATPSWSSLLFVPDGPRWNFQALTG